MDRSIGLEVFPFAWNELLYYDLNERTISICNLLDFFYFLFHRRIDQFDFREARMMLKYMKKEVRDA